MYINRRKDKEDVVHIYDRIITQPWKQWNNSICSNMDGPIDFHTEWRKADIIWYCLYVQSLKKGTNELTKLRQSHNVESKLMFTSG